MTDRIRVLSFAGLVVLGLISGPGFAAGATARECLSQAVTAAQAVELAGDQSAARRYIACSLSRIDPHAALELASGIRRPSDAARALGWIALGLAGTDAAGARLAAADASQLLLRIVEPSRREQEERLLLAEMAALGQDALLVAPELPADDARLAVVVARAGSDPAGALALLRSWQLGGPSSDRAQACIALGLGETDPDQALKLAAAISSDSLRERTVWQIAEARPPAEAYGIAQRVTDPLIRSALLTSAAVRMASDSAEGAFAWVQEVEVAPDSARAQLAVALAVTDPARALGLARSLPPRPRAWALAQLAIRLVASPSGPAQSLLTDIGATPEVARLATARLAAADPARALRLARSLPVGDARDAALSAVAPAIAASDSRQAADLLWEIDSPQARVRAAEALALRLAATDAEAATSLIGLVSEPQRALRLRAQVAAAIAPRDAAAAERLLRTLPPSSSRTEAALQAAASMLLAGRDPQEALRLATIGLDHDLALRWLLPTLALSGTASPVNLAESISDPYLRALALTDVARRVERTESGPKPCPARARMVRPVVEWEGL